jgi:hypothetical protein
MINHQRHTSSLNHKFSQVFRRNCCWLNSFVFSGIERSSVGPELCIHHAPHSRSHTHSHELMWSSKFLCPLWFGSPQRSVKPSPIRHSGDTILRFLRLPPLFTSPPLFIFSSKPIWIPPACYWSHICYVFVTKLPSIAVSFLHLKRSFRVSLSLSFPHECIPNGLFTHPNPTRGIP